MSIHYGAPHRHSSTSSHYSSQQRPPSTQYGAPPPQGYYGHSQPPYGRPPPSVGPPAGADPQLWQWFSSVDTDRSGAISVTELQSALVNGASPPSPSPSRERPPIGRAHGGISPTENDRR